MRMWDVNPKFLCRKHLLGEHVELHMFAGSLLKGKSLDGFIKKGLVNLECLAIRHNKLAEEIIKRGWNHKSPYPDISAELTRYDIVGKVDKNLSISELRNRCKECKKIQDAYKTI